MHPALQIHLQWKQTEEPRQDSMENLMEHLTTSEAAVAAGVSVPQVQRIIDEQILPNDLYSTVQMRTFRTEACVLIAFYFETAELLTASARLRAIRNVREHCRAWDSWKNCTFEEHSVTVRFFEIWKGGRSPPSPDSQSP